MTQNFTELIDKLTSTLDVGDQKETLIKLTEKLDLSEADPDLLSLYVQAHWGGDNYTVTRYPSIARLENPLPGDKMLTSRSGLSCESSMDFQCQPRSDQRDNRAKEDHGDAPVVCQSPRRHCVCVCVGRWGGRCVCV